jgi:hypothetical protein
MSSELLPQHESISVPLIEPYGTGALADPSNEMHQYCAEHYDLDPVVAEEPLEIPNLPAGCSAKRVVSGPRILTRREIAKVQIELNREWEVFCNCSKVVPSQSVGLYEVRETLSDLNEISERIAWLRWHIARICRQSGLRRDESLPRRPAHFQEWLKKKLYQHLDCDELFVPHAIAQHSPCGCNPVSEKWDYPDNPFTGERDDGPLQFNPAKLFKIKREGDGFYHDDCGELVMRLDLDMPKSERYYLLQDSRGFIQRLVEAKGVALSEHQWRRLYKLSDSFFSKVVNVLRDRFGYVFSFSEELTNKELNQAVERELESRSLSRAVVCLDRYLLQGDYKFSVHRFGINRRSNGQLSPRAFEPSLDEQLEALVADIGRKEVAFQ